MKIIEQFVSSKTGDLSTCEDGILVTPNFICVVDGVSSKSPLRWQENKTGGQMARDVAFEVIKNFDENIDAQSAIIQINKEIAKHYKNNPQRFLKNSYDRIEGVIILFSRAKQQVWSYGDCQALVNGKFYSFEMKVDKINSEMRSLYNKLLLASGMETLESLQENDLGRQIILPTLTIQSVLANQNHELGYPVLNGINFNENLLKIIPVAKGSEVVLASDGYPELKGTLEESEKHLAKVLKDDKLLINDYKATKALGKNASFDDRSYIRFVT